MTGQSKISLWMAGILASAVLVNAGASKSPAKMKMSAPIPAGIATPDQVKANQAMSNPITDDTLFIVENDSYTYSGDVTYPHFFWFYVDFYGESSSFPQKNRMLTR